MRHLLLIIGAFLVLNLVNGAQAARGSELKIEGTCSGNLLDGTELSLTYYSDFDGYKKVSKSAVNFTSGFEGLYTGSRVFKNHQDIYNFPRHKLVLKDSTGNTGANFEYRDQENVLRTVRLLCDIRDYEYP